MSKVKINFLTPTTTVKTNKKTSNLVILKNDSFSTYLHILDKQYFNKKYSYDEENGLPLYI